MVSELLGHSSVAFTMQVYSHVLPGMLAEAQRQLAERLLGAPAQPEGATPIQQVELEGKPDAHLP